MGDHFAMLSAETCGGVFVAEHGLTIEQTIAMLQEDPRDLRGTVYVKVAGRYAVNDADGNDSGGTVFEVTKAGRVLLDGDPITVADVIAGEQANALRDIATIIGSPANADPLTDLDGLVSMVRGLAERVVGVEARIADAVAADRMAAGEWVRADSPGSRVQIASAIEHGDHIDDDVPPLPSLRMTLLLRDELLRQVESLTAERDRRIEPVVHARAVMDSYIEGFGDSREASQMGDPKKAWREWSDSRQRLLDRLGGLLAEVER